MTLLPSAVTSALVIFGCTQQWTAFTATAKIVPQATPVSIVVGCETNPGANMMCFSPFSKCYPTTTRCRFKRSNREDGRILVLPRRIKTIGGFRNTQLLSNPVSITTQEGSNDEPSLKDSKIPKTTPTSPDTHVIKFESPAYYSYTHETNTQNLHTTDHDLNLPPPPPLLRPVMERNEEFSNSLTWPSPLHNIFLISKFLNSEQVSTCLDMAIKHASETGCWKEPSSRHVSYRTVDFSLLPNEHFDDELDEDGIFYVQDDGPPPEEFIHYLHEIQFQDRVFAKLEQLYGIPSHTMEFLDLFCACYEAHDESDGHATTMDRLPLHRDGSMLSFTLVLSDPQTDFQGGGTTFDSLAHNGSSDKDEILSKEGVIQPKNAGDVVMHCGKLYHGAHPVTSGRRIVLVGFVDVHDAEEDALNGVRILEAGRLHQACRMWGRLDVMNYREARQAKQKEARGVKYWTVSRGNKKEEQKQADGGHAKEQKQWGMYVKPRNGGVMPRNDVVKARTEEEFQRLRRLQVEDWFLRGALQNGNRRP